MDPISAGIFLVGVKLLLRHNVRRQIRTETDRTIELILTLLRDGYSIHTLHDIARKKRAWTLADPTEDEWRNLFRQGRRRHKKEVDELVQRYQNGETTRALVKAVVKDGPNVLKNMRVQRATGIIPSLVEAGYDMNQLNTIFANGQDLGRQELGEAISVVIHDNDAKMALLHHAVELGQLYHETGEVSDVVERVASVGIDALESGWDLLEGVTDFLAALLT
jgi:hypothetical protein